MPVVGRQQKNLKLDQTNELVSWRTAEKSAIRGEHGALRRFCSPLKFIGGKMKKEEAVHIIVSCAKQYHENLENQNLLFVFGEASQIDFFESRFLPENFVHLTGIVIENKIGRSEFYERCIKNKIRLNDFSFKSDGTTEMKLTVLPRLMEIHRCANMVGDYDCSGTNLYTEKVAGNVCACLGFVCKGKYYIPNTALKEDVRDITTVPWHRVLAIYKKDIHQEYYKTRCYIAKKLKNLEQILPYKIAEKITEINEHENPKTLDEQLATAKEQADRQNAGRIPPMQKKAPRLEK